MPPSVDAITVVAAGGAIEGHAEVVLVLDAQALLDEQALNLFAFGAGLVGDQLHAVDVFDGLLGVCFALADFDAAAFAAAASVDLRLDDDDVGAGLFLHVRNGA